MQIYQVDKCKPVKCLRGLLAVKEPQWWGIFFNDRMKVLGVSRVGDFFRADSVIDHFRGVCFVILKVLALELSRPIQLFLHVNSIKNV